MPPRPDGPRFFLIRLSSYPPLAQVDLLHRQIEIDEGKAAHKSERQAVERRAVVDVHGADDTPVGMDHVVVAAGQDLNRNQLVRLVTLTLAYGSTRTG